MSNADDPSTPAGSEVPLEHAKELGEALAHIEVLRAAHETLALGVTGANEAINALGARMDSIVQAQGETLEAIAKLKPAEAAGAEAQGAEDAVTGGEGTDPPPGVGQVAEKESNNLVSGFHRVFG